MSGVEAGFLNTWKESGFYDRKNNPHSDDDDDDDDNDTREKGGEFFVFGEVRPKIVVSAGRNGKVQERRW